MNKIEKLNLTLEEPLEISVPGIRQLPLTLECKVIFKLYQQENILPEELYKRYYPATEAQPGGDYHTAYYGQIVGAYIITD